MTAPPSINTLTLQEVAELKEEDIISHTATATQLPTATATHRGALRHRCLKFDGSIFLYSILCYPRGCTNLIMLLESQVHLPSQKASLTVKNFMPNLCALFPARLCYCWMMASSRRLTMTVAASK